MKKIKIILMVLALSLVFTGCIDEEMQNSSGDKVINSQESEQNEINTPFSMGEWNEKTYTNEFLQVKLTLPEEWQYSTDEEIAQIMELSSEITFGDNESLAKLAELTSVYYVVASNANTGDNFSILTEKPLADVSIDYYMQQLKTQLASVEAITYNVGDISNEMVGNMEYTTLNVQVPDYGMFQKYYVRKHGKYFVGIILTSATEDSMNEMISFFN